MKEINNLKEKLQSCFSELETMDVWAVWKSLKGAEVNLEQFPVDVCVTQATAMRIEKDFKLAGGDAVVTKAIAIKVNDVWLVPGRIIPPTILDEKAQKRIDALKRAEEAGLSPEDLQALSEG